VRERENWSERKRKYYLTANIIKKYEINLSCKRDTESHRNKTKQNDE